MRPGEQVLMKKNRRNKAWVVAACSSMVLTASVAQAQGSAAQRNANQRIETLQQQLTEQGQQIETLRETLRQQAAEQQTFQREQQRLEQERQEALRAVQQGPKDGGGKAPGDSPDAAGRSVRVGVAPGEETQPPPVAPLFDQPGILTPPGRYVIEPSLQYGYSSSNRVALVGYTVIPALLIGLIDVREVKRNTVTAAVTGRWGLSNRLEVEAKLPYVYRSDATISRELFTGTASENAFNSSGRAIGDIELAARYQLNQPQGNAPYMIGSLRFKTRTGKDPFEVVTDCVTRCLGNTTGTGLPLDLPTGSGFYSLQTGVTWLFPSDPAVFFGGLSYTHNFKRDNISRTVLNDQKEFIGSVQPGGVLGVNFGMGLALNERSSFSVGVELNSIARTRQNGAAVASSVRTQLSSLLLGYSYRYSPKTTLNVTVGAGLTRDTPDLTLTVRLPMLY